MKTVYHFYTNNYNDYSIAQFVTDWHNMPCYVDYRKNSDKKWHYSITARTPREDYILTLLILAGSEGLPENERQLYRQKALNTVFFSDTLNSIFPNE